MKTKLAVLFVLISCIIPSFIYADIVISGATDTTVEAVDENGAVVSFTPTAADAEFPDATIDMSCDPASGSTFAIGTTTVTCTASHATSSVQAQFTVTVTEVPDPEPEPEVEPLVLSGSIDLKNGCDVTDDTGAVHVFPAADSASEYLVICALQQALETGIVTVIDFDDFGFGLFVANFNDFEIPENTYWQLRVNDISSNVGATEAILNVGDTVSFVLTAFDPDTFVETTLDSSVTLTINALTDTYNNIVLPNRCTVTVGDETQDYPVDDSPSDYLGICALAVAKEDGIITDYELVEFEGFGLFADSVNGIKDPDTSFWALYYNNVFEESRGLIILPLALGDTMSLIFTNFITNATSDRVDVRVIALEEIDEEPDEEEDSGGDSGGGLPPPSPQFSVPLALAFLSSVQNADGSFANTLISDWAAIAFAASDPGAAKTKLRNYLLTNPAAGSDTTDYERRAMALMALGINPYSGTGVDHITPIVNAFDGTQIGAVFPHDDIFAIFPLLKAGYSTGDEIIQKAVAYIVLKQNADGSWGDPDSTAAAVQALTLVGSESGVADALTKAKAYLHTQQQSDGGFSNSFSTSWVLQGITAFGESPATWTSNAKTPLDYLTSLQQTDGGVDLSTVGTDNRAWATAYAVPGVLGKTWDSLLSSFSKPSGGSAGSTTSVTTAATTTTATSTPLVATSTLVTATTTEPTSVEATEEPDPIEPTIESLLAELSSAQLALDTLTPKIAEGPSVPEQPRAPEIETLAEEIRSEIDAATQVAAVADADISLLKRVVERIWELIASFFAWIL